MKNKLGKSIALIAVLGMSAIANANSSVVNNEKVLETLEGSFLDLKNKSVEEVLKAETCTEIEKEVLMKRLQENFDTKMREINKKLK